MNSFRRVVTPCRIVLYVKRNSLFTNVPIQLSYSVYTQSFVHNLHTFGATSMSQKSITSFFKMTPKKAAEVNKENQEEVRTCKVTGHWVLISKDRNGQSIFTQTSSK